MKLKIVLKYIKWSGKLNFDFLVTLEVHRRRKREYKLLYGSHLARKCSTRARQSLVYMHPKIGLEYNFPSAIPDETLEKNGH